MIRKRPELDTENPPGQIVNRPVIIERSKTIGGIIDRIRSQEPLKRTARPDQWYIDRRVVCDSYPASEARFTTLEEYVEHTEKADLLRKYWLTDDILSRIMFLAKEADNYAEEGKFDGYSDYKNRLRQFLIEAAGG